MNRYPLNARVLGAGSQIPLTMATAVQVMYLTAAAAAHAIRGMRANGQLSNTVNVRTRITRVFEATQALTLAAVVAPRVWFKTYIAGTVTFALSTNVNVRQLIRRTVTAVQSLSLTSTFTIHQWIKTYAQGVQNLAMSTRGKFSRRLFPVIRVSQAISGSLRMLATRHWVMSKSLALNGSADVRTAVRSVVDASVQLLSTVEGRLAVRFEWVSTLALGVRNKLTTAIRSTASQVFSLFSSVDVLDVTTLPATADRTVAINEVSRIVVVPGESYESGV